MKIIIKISLLLIALVFCVFLSSCDIKEGTEPESEEIKVCKHASVEKTVISPTCIDDGMTVNACTSCGAVFYTDITNHTGHSLSSEDISSTCDEQGYTLNHCTKCNFTEKVDIKPLKEHSFDILDETEATCEHGKITNKICALCGKTETSVTEAPGHDLKVITTQHPTFNADGYTLLSCAKCEKEVKEDVVKYGDIFTSAYISNSDVVAKGIDISAWQENVDWVKVKESGIDYVILRAGTRNKDSYFERNYSGAKAAGLDVGAYMYVYETTLEGYVNAAKMLKGWIAGKQFEYPIYLDLEAQELLDAPNIKALSSADKKKAITDMCMAFLDEMQKDGYYTGIYFNFNWFNNYIDKSMIVSHFDIWGARYRSTDYEISFHNVGTFNKEGFGGQISMWQFSETGRVNGVTGNVDMNLCYKDYKGFMKKWKLNGYT